MSVCPKNQIEKERMFLKRRWKQTFRKTIWIRSFDNFIAYFCYVSTAVPWDNKNMRWNCFFSLVEKYELHLTENRQCSWRVWWWHCFAERWITAKYYISELEEREKFNRKLSTPNKSESYYQWSQSFDI